MLNRLYKSGLFKPVYFLTKKVFAVFAYLIPYKYKKAVEPTLSLDIIRNYNKNRALGPRKIICNAPFKHMYFKQNGNVTACCASNVDAYGNIRENSVNDIWKGDKANQLRERIKNYNLSGGCSGCQHSLESGNYNAFIGRIYDTLLPSVAQDYPTEMTFEISNTCNLECVMCTGEFSNLIRKNIEKLPDIPNYYDEHFFEEIKAFLPYLKRVRFMGGEPFLIKQYEPIMEFLVEHNPDCKIYIQTNGTILNNFVKKIIETKNVEISISIDSLKKEMYEKIRKNGNYERTMENLVYFSERAKKHDQLININFCVMNTNWNEVPDILDFCDKNNFTINLIPVEYPGYLSLRICKAEHLEKILSFSEFNTNEIKNVRLLSVYKNYVSYLYSLIDRSIEHSKKIKELMSWNLTELFMKAKDLFLLLNHIDGSSKESKIFDNAYEVLYELSETEKKQLLSNLISDCDYILNDMIDNKEQTHMEISSKLTTLFNNMKKELEYTLSM